MEVQQRTRSFETRTVFTPFSMYRDPFFPSGGLTIATRSLAPRMAVDSFGTATESILFLMCPVTRATVASKATWQLMMPVLSPERSTMRADSMILLGVQMGMSTLFLTPAALVIPRYLE